MRKWVLIGLSVVVLAAVLVTVAVADTAAISCELANCKKIYAYSGNAAAYFFGFHGSTLVSTRVIPDRLTRSVSVRGSILSACHDETKVYALYKASLHAYMVVTLNMDSGEYTEKEVACDTELMHTSFAAAQDEIFVTVVENGSSYVRGIRGGATDTYRFSADIERLFVCDNAAYVRLNGGIVFRIGKGKYYPADGLTDEQEQTLAAAQMLTVTIGGRTVVLHADYTLEIFETADSLAAPSAEAADSGFRIEGEFLIALPGASVSQLKAAFAEAIVFRADGTALTAGRLKTGFSVKLNNITCMTAVLGDVNGSGTINSADTARLMQSFVGSETLSGCFRRAADYNSDGQIDNRDLVMMARM